MANKIDVVTRPRKEVEALVQHLQLDIDDNGVIDMGEVKLVLNRKQDAYYTVTKNACSCPDFLFRQSAKGEFCKHQKLLYKKVLFPRPREEAPKTMNLRESIWEAEKNSPFATKPKARGVA
jgi:hypothetical protein